MHPNNPTIHNDILTAIWDSDSDLLLFYDSLFSVEEEEEFWSPITVDTAIKIGIAAALNHCIKDNLQQGLRKYQADFQTRCLYGAFVYAGRNITLQPVVLHALGNRVVIKPDAVELTIAIDESRECLIKAAYSNQH